MRERGEVYLVGSAIVRITSSYTRTTRTTSAREQEVGEEVIRCVLMVPSKSENTIKGESA